MEFPAYKLEKIPVTQAMIDAIGATPSEAYMGRDLLCVFDDEKTVRNLQPDMNKLLNLDGLWMCTCIFWMMTEGKNAELFEEAFYEKKNLDPQMHVQQENNNATVADEIDPELLAKVLANPEMRALLNSLAKTMK